MANVIETLIIKIGADVIDFSKGMGVAQKELKDTEKVAQGTARGMTQAFDQAVGNTLRRLAALTAGFVGVRAAIGAFNSIIDDAADMGRLSQQTGIAVERLSELRFAVGALGVPFETVTQAIAGFSQRMAEGLANSASNVSLVVADMGLKMRDAAGNVRQFSDVLPEIMDRFRAMPDGIAKTQRAVALFGEEAGPRLIPFLNQGSAGLEELIRRARELGVTLDQDAVRKAQEFQRAIFELGESLKPILRQLIPELTPILQRVAEGVTNLVAGYNEWNRVTSGTSENLDVLTRRLQRFRAERDQIAGGIFGEAFLPQADRDRLAYVNEQIRIMEENLRRLNAERARAAEEGVRIEVPLPINSLPTLDVLRQAQDNARFSFDQWMERLQGSRTIFDELNFVYSDHATRVEQAMDRIAGAYGDSAEAARKSQQVKAALAKLEQQQILQVAQTAASTITALFPKSKGAAIAAAVINTAVGITKALSELLPPWSWIQAGLIAAQGAAQIATIRSTTESGGPTPTTGGGGGAVAAAPAESPTNRSVTVMGLDPAALFSGAQMEQLVGQLNEETKHGRTLISTQLRPT